MARSPTNDTSTRQRLLAAAIDRFGRRGFDGASIRDIAKAAGANIAGIAYHFGSKEQLYRACLEHIAQTMRHASGAISRPEAGALSPEEARRALKHILFNVTEFMLATPGAASFARIVVREQMDPSGSFDILYSEFMEPLHRRLCALWAMAAGEEAESDATKLAVFSLLGQVLLFRIARAGALRRMGWRDIGQREMNALKERLAANVDLLARPSAGERP